MPTSLDDFELANKPSDLSDFQVVPQASTATVGKLPSAQDISDFEVITPPQSPADFGHPELSSKAVVAGARPAPSPEDSEVVRQAQAQGKPVVMVGGRPTIGEAPVNPPLSTGEGVTQGIESALGTTALRIGAGASRLAGQSKTADALSSDAAQFQAQEPTDTASKIGQGIGSAASLAGSGGLTGALASTGLQSQADKLSFSAALKSAPELAAYWLLGMGASKLAGPLLSQSTPFVKALGQGAAATTANAASSAAIRMVNGQPVMPDAESLAQDALFGFGAHGIEAGREAVKDEAHVKAMLEQAPEDALRAAAADPNFRKSAPYSPGLVDDELKRRGVTSDSLTQDKLKELAPDKIPETEPRAASNAEFLDGLNIARRKLAMTPDEFAALPPEVQQARQQQIDEIDEQLLSHPKDAVSESAARTAQPQPLPEQPEQPAGPEVQGSPPVQGGRSSLFSQALSEQVVAPVKQAAEAAQEIAPETAKAAEQIADTLAQKVSSPPVEPPASGEAPEPVAGAEGTPADAVPVATEEGAMKPAIQLPNGQVTTGEDHVSAYEKAKETTPDTSGSKEGFVDEKGNFISREEAAAKTGLPTDTEPGKLHSSDLPKTRGAFKPDELSKFMDELGEDEPPAAPQARKPLTKEETIAALNRELDSARDDDRTHDVTRLKKRIKELSAQPEPESERVIDNTPDAAKKTWQKTRDQVESEDGSLAKHRIEVRKAVAAGKEVPLEVLEDYKNSAWADKAREQKYGQQISDTLLTKILKGLSDDPSKQYSDPLFLQSIGKPALRAAVRIMQEGIEAGKLGHDAVGDAIKYLKTQIPTLNEDKANEFFDRFFEPSETAPEPQPEQRSVETPPEPVSGDARPEPASTPVETDGARLTSTKNAVVDEERVKRGEPPILSEAKKSLGEVWEEAMRKIEYDPNAGTNLVKELNGKPRAINAVEEATLLHHKVTVSNDLARQTERALSDTASDAERMESRVEAARLTDELNDIDNATRNAGTEWGRTGRFRQVLAAEDYSLARMLQQKQLATGKALTPEETEQVSKLSARIAELEKQSAEHEEQKAAMEDKLKDSEADKRIAEVIAKQTPAEKYAQGLVQKIQQGLKSQADAARERIRARLGKASAGVDPVVIYDAAIIGAEKLFSAGLDFAKWSKGMIEDLGEFIQPHLEEIWDKSKAINEDAVEKGAPKPLREKIKAKAATDADKRNAIVETIRSRKGANEAIGSQIQKLAENFVRNGITEREALVSAVHDAVKDALPEATPRDIRDAISGYGDFKELSKDETKAKLRDLKGQMQQLSKIEDITAEGKAKKTGVQRRIPTAEERRLLAEVNRVKKEYGIESDDPEALASALGAAKTRLRNRIEDLKTAIAKGEKLPAKGKKIVDDDETAQLRKDKDALQAEYDAAFGNPKLTPDEIALKVYKTRTAKRIADLQERVKNGDFASKPRKTVELDSEGLKLKADAERAKLDFDRANYRDKLKNRSTWEKMADVFPKVSRAFLLSSPATIGKLFAAAMWRMVATPVEEGIGAGLSKLPYVSDIAARAPREGGSLGVQGEAKVFTRGVTKGMKDALDMLRKGETDLDVVGGKKNIIPHEWIDFIGNMHGAMKSVAKRNEFERSFQKRSEFNMRHGIDVTDPLVQSRMMVEAYQDANRSIFQQDNRVVSIWNTAMKRLEEKSKITGRPTVSGKVGQVVGKTLLPIVKIPTNIVAETLQYATGALTGSARVAAAFRRGVETLKPEEADLIMRDLKKGSLGAAVMTLGFLAPQVIGGYYQYGKKRRDDDVKAGNVKLYGQNIPPTMLHNPAVEQLQIGATVRRVADSKLRNKDQDTQGIPAGVLAAALGITSEVPFVHETIDVAKLFNPYERSQFMGQLAKSRLEPAILQQAAAHFDKDASGEPVQRDPKTVGEYLKSGIPGLREQVPQKRGRLNRAFAPRYAR